MRALRDTIFFCLESPGKSGGQDADRPSAPPVCAAPTRPSSAAADPAGAPLACLASGGAGGALASRLRAFHGASGRRYVTTAFDPADPAWLDIEGAVLLVVSRASGAARIVAAHAGPDAAARRRILQTLLAGEGPCEIHLHLLAADPAARRAAAIDLIGAPH
jgi:hypothetical protein